MTAISIHTPTKGATCLNIYKPRKDGNFNPHSHEGSDYRSRTRPTMITVFQSTLPRRERQSIRADENKRKIISIHTPTKGATIRIGGYLRWDLNFNPHSHEGSDANLELLCIIFSIFQSTLPRRERQNCKFCRSMQLLYFNPHSHEGSDVSDLMLVGLIILISIHTPTKGATKLIDGLWKLCIISIHTPTKGAT